MKAFAALYNDMTMESGYSTISVHKTKQGARDTLAKYIKKEKKERDSRQEGKPSRMTYYFFQILWHTDWAIDEIEVLD